MKTSRRSRLSLRLFCAALPLLSVSATAASLNWDADGVSGAPTGGTGTWNTTSTFWDDAGTMVTWNNGTPDSASFGGTAGTVTLGESITAGTVSFDTAGYTLLGGGMDGPALSASGITLNADATFGDSSTTGNTVVRLAGDLTGTGTLTSLGAWLASDSATPRTVSAPLLIGAGDGTRAIRLGDTINTGTLTFTGTVTTNGVGRGIEVMTGSIAVFQNGVTGGGNSITKGGAGSLVLGGSSTYTGLTTINSGTLALDEASGGQLYQTNGFFGAQNQNYIVINTGGTFQTWNWSYGISNAIAQMRENYGQILLDGGTLRFDDTFSSTRAFTVGANGGTLEVTAGNTYTKNGGTTGSENIIRFSANSTLTVTGDGNAVINDALGAYGSTGFSIAKTGSGTLTLGGASTYTGTTSVSGGLLRVNNTLRNTSGMTVSNGATLELGTINMFTTGHGSAMADTRVLTADGGTLLMNGSMDSRIGNVTLLNGATWTSNRGLGNYDVLLANTTVGAATVTVGGTGVSTMNGSGGIHLQGIQNFNVAEVTGNTNADLNVTMRLDNPGTAGGDAGGIRKQGAGTMRLTNTGNSFAGNIIIEGGTLIGEGVSSGSTTPLGNATGTRTITVNDTGTLAFIGNNVFGGSTRVLANIPKVVVNAGGTMTINTYNVVGNVDLNGSTLTATGGSNGSYQTYEFAGGSTITVGGSVASLVSSTAPSNGGMHIAGNGTLTLDVADVTASSATDLTISAALLNGSNDRPGAGALLKTGLGTVTLSAGGSYTGGTTLAQGTIIATNGNALGTGGTVTINNPTTGSADTSLFLNASATVGRAITVANEGSGVTTLGSSSLSSGNQSIFSGAVTLNKSVTLQGTTGGDRTQFSGGIGGTGNVTIAGTGRIIFIGSANTYDGSTTVDGILQLSDGTGTATSFIPDTSAVTVNSGASLRLAKGAGNSETIGGLSGTGTVEAISGNNTLVVGGGDATSTFGGVLKNSGATLSLDKTGGGTLTLTGTNTYTGATNVSGGTLLVSNTSGSGTGTGSVTVSSGTLGGTGTIGGSVSVAADGNVAPGASAGTLNISGNLDISAMSAGAGKLKFELDTLAGTNDRIAVAGTVALGTLALDDLEITNLGGLEAGTYTLITSSGLSGGVDGTVGLITAGFNGQLQTSGSEVQLVVTVIPPSDYDNWKDDYPGFTNSAPGQDHDGDGLTNFDEYAFGLDPTDPASISPVTPPDKTAGTFTYTRRKPSLTGLTYSYHSSTTLSGTWPAFTPPVADITNNGDPVETITVTIPPLLLSEPSLFLRVHATQP